MWPEHPPQGKQRYKTKKQQIVADYKELGAQDNTDN